MHHLRQSFTTNNVKNYYLKAPNPLYCLIFLISLVCHLYAIRMSFSYQLYVLVCHSYISYVICMSHLCTRMSSVCHSYILVCHPYVTRIYSYVIRMSLVYTPMPSVCHSYVVLPWTFFCRLGPHINMLCTLV